MFTNTNTIHHFYHTISATNLNLQTFNQAQITYIKPTTTNTLTSYTIQPNIVPNNYQTKNLLTTLNTKTNIKNKQFLFPQTKITQNIIPNTLHNNKNIINIIPIYKTIQPQINKKNTHHHITLTNTITFTNPSSITNLITLLKKKTHTLLTPQTLTTIKPITIKTLKNTNFTTSIVTQISTINKLIKSLIKHNIQNN